MFKNFMLTKKYSDECDNLDSGKVVTTEYANMQKLFQLSLVLLYDRCIQNTERVVVENAICNDIANKKCLLRILCL